jgi:cold shock CspA family protein
MNHNNTITTKRFARQTSVWLCLALLAFAVQLIAHGGFDHVIGTVVKVENNILTVKTAKGNVDVQLNEKTTITKNDQKAGTADLKPGTRVVVDVPEGRKDKIAHSVKVGVSGMTGTHAPSPQK